MSIAILRSLQIVSRIGLMLLQIEARCFKKVTKVCIDMLLEPHRFQ